MTTEAIPATVAWVGGSVRLIDQRRLPESLTFLECRTVGQLVVAVRDLAVRGAPALGAVGAYGVALAAATLAPADVVAAVETLRVARPTAVNLAWGVERALDAFTADGEAGALACAEAIAAADVAANRALGAAGAALLPRGARVLTHCNAGALACVGYGTALGVVRAAHESGNPVTVWVDETRPVLQGARLTAWELDRLGIPFRVVVDAAAGSLLAAGSVDAVVVGADRVAANGDVANKIGTYGLAVLAEAHGVPFYVAAPTSTVDLATASGAQIPIEERAPTEIGHLRAHNPAFDVTPARLVTALVTERGVLTAPDADSLAGLLA